MSLRQRIVRFHQWLVPCHEALGTMPYFWLIYLSFPLIPLVFWEADPAVTMMTLACVVVFIPLYFRSFALQGADLIHYCAAMVVIGTILAPFNAMANVFFVYAASFAPFIGSVRLGSLLITVIAALLVLVSYIFQPLVTFWAIGGLLVIMVGFGNLVFEEKNRALRRSRAETERIAAIAERERIARDLHDLLGHSLSMITLKAELAARVMEQDPERARREIREVEATSRQALADVRRAVTGYRRADLTQELNTARSALSAASIQAHVDAAPHELDAPTELALCMLLREGVTNVVRHSEATRCEISFREADDELVVAVVDDGNGEAGREGSGLTGMRERCAALGGTLERECSEQGTTLRASLPLRDGGVLDVDAVAESVYPQL